MLQQKHHHTTAGVAPPLRRALIHTLARAKCAIAPIDLNLFHVALLSLPPHSVGQANLHPTPPRLRSLRYQLRVDHTHARNQGDKGTAFTSRVIPRLFARVIPRRFDQSRCGWGGMKSLDKISTRSFDEIVVIWVQIPISLQSRSHQGGTPKNLIHMCCSPQENCAFFLFYP